MSNPGSEVEAADLDKTGIVTVSPKVSALGRSGEDGCVGWANTPALGDEVAKADLDMTWQLPPVPHAGQKFLLLHPLKMHLQLMRVKAHNGT